MANKETVGDMIVRHRMERMASPRCTERERKEILSRPRPRSIRDQEWPPRG